MPEEYETRILSLIVKPKKEPIFSEMATTISIVDESGGEFIELSQPGRSDLGKIAIEFSEWPEIKKAVDRMIEESRQNDTSNI